MSTPSGAGLSRVLQTAQSFDTYRNYVGSEDKYDLLGAMQFNLLTGLGLREHHRLLDIGCGSLRAGRLFIPYLQAAHYFGIDPNQWLIDDGIANNVGADLARIKQPRFSNNADFDLSGFGETFDFLLAQSIFTHTSAAQVRACLAQVKRVLAPGGVFAVDYFEGAASYAGDDWVYPGVVEFALADLQAWTRDAGLQLQPIRCLHPNGMRWAVVFDTAPPTGVVFSDGAGPVTGHFDGIAQVAEHVWQLHGWAAMHDQPGQACEVLLITADQRVLGRASTGQARPDVAAALGDPVHGQSGWRTTISTASLPVGQHLITAYAREPKSSPAWPLGRLALDVRASLADADG